MTGESIEAKERFGPFRVFERLGVGGTASVYRAVLERKDGTRLEVSLKRLHPHLAVDVRVVKEFVDEARIARLMVHDNISRFYQVGRLGSEYFIATEYIEGIDLGRLLSRAHGLGRPPSTSVVLSLLVQLCSALDYAHERVDDQTGEKLEFVHRDISPSNLIVTPEGRLKLIDMGIAKSRTSTIKTDTGIIKGKLGYMAPEVVSGGEADRRADIFGIGVVAWELITATRLFGGGPDVETIDKIQIGARHPPSSRNPACPPQIDSIVMRALAPRAVDRWASAGHMQRALVAAAATLHEPVSDQVIAEWLTSSLQAQTPRPAGESSQIPTVTANTPSPTPNADRTTRVHERPHRTAPRPPSKFPNGTGTLPLAPPETTELHTAVPSPRPPRLDSTAAVAPLGYQARAAEPHHSRILAAVVGASLVVNVVLIIGLVAARSGPTPVELIPMPPAVVAVDMTATAAEDAAAAAPEPAAEPPAIADIPMPALPPPPPEPPPMAVEDIPMPALPPPVVPMVDVDRLTQVYGKHPRSRSTTAAYVARLCIDEHGKVTSVIPSEGPERLYRRIKRRLKHWRYKPYHRGGRAVPVCFEIHEHLRKR